MWPGWGKGCSLLLSVRWGFFSWEMQRYCENWLGVRGWAQLSHSLSQDWSGDSCGFGAGLLFPGEFVASAEFFVLHCFSFLWVSLCLQEQLLKWDLFNTRPQWEGEPDPSPEGVSPGCLWKPGFRCPAAMFSASASGFFATLLPYNWCPPGPPQLLSLLQSFSCTLFCHPRCACLCCSNLLL